MLFTSLFYSRGQREYTASSPSFSHRSKGSALPLTLAGIALILSGCGGGNSGSSSSTPAMDADQNPFAPVQGGGTVGALVPDGQFAGLDQSCVDTLLDIDPNAAPNLIQLTCRPENIEADPSIPVAGPSIEDPVLLPPIDTPPVTTAGLNIAPPDVAGGSYYQNSRVSALLTGPQFGSGAVSNADLVKPLSVQIGNVGAGLNLIELRALVDDNGGSNADYLAVVQNTSSEFLCSVTIDDIAEFSSTGEQLDGSSSLPFALLSGETGVREDSTFYFSSCLTPGSLGYMTSFRDVRFDQVAEVRTGSLRSSTGLSQVEGVVLPVSYSVEADGSVSVTLVNNHSETLDVFAIDTIAIDEQGHAFAWNSQVPSTQVAPGAELVVDNVFPRFQGRTSTIRVIVDFDLP